MVLPVVQAAVFVVLMSLADTQPSQRLPRPTPLQEGQVGWDPVFIHAPPPRPFVIAMALNLPAVLLATPLMLVLASASPVLDRIPEWVFVVLLTPFVAYWWFLVGRWIDRRLGWLPDPHPLSTPEARVIYWMLASAALILFAILAFFRDHHGNDSLRYASPWCVFASAVFFRRARRPVSQPPSGVS